MTTLVYFMTGNNEYVRDDNGRLIRQSNGQYRTQTIYTGLGLNEIRNNEGLTIDGAPIAGNNYDVQLINSDPDQKTATLVIYKKPDNDIFLTKFIQLDKPVSVEIPVNGANGTNKQVILIGISDFDVDIQNPTQEQLENAIYRVGRLTGISINEFYNPTLNGEPGMGS